VKSDIDKKLTEEVKYTVFQKSDAETEITITIRQILSATEVGPVLNETSPCQEIHPTTFWHCNPYSTLKL